MSKHKQTKEEVEFLNNYDSGNYDRPSVTADILILTTDPSEDTTVFKGELRVLLIKRKGHPFKDCWALPGGFVGINEDIEAAAYRELKEETGVDNCYLEQLYTFGKPERDPRMRVISVAYMALTPREKCAKLLAGDDASEAAWFRIQISDNTKEIIGLVSEDDTVTINMNDNKSIHTNAELAFDHDEIISLGLKRLQNKIWYTPVACSLMPELFTISELIKVYESILREKLYKSNFKNRVNQFLEPTEQKYLTDGVHMRPATLFRMKKEKKDEHNK